MSIEHNVEKINPIVRFEDVPPGSPSVWFKIHSFARSLYVPILLIVVASIFFALGRLSTIERNHTPIRVVSPNNSQTGAVIQAVGVGVDSSQGEGNSVFVATGETTGGQVIGSKTGKKYYFPWCSTVKRIKPENQVPFASIADARSAGYTPGGNCKGLK
ncbi:MAG: hypothetical protein QG589_586 [Patescibacteria group bacterium]|nr:hypothetical protein [Patescibacteria group bacterium]